MSELVQPKPAGGVRELSPAPEPPRGWSRSRWVALSALVCSLQVGLVFWLSDRRSVEPQSAAASSLRLANQIPQERLALTDPTLFALPHRQSFSWQGWMSNGPPAYEPYVWQEDEQRNWLALSPVELGEALQQFVATNVFAAPHVAMQPAPELKWPEAVEATALPERSSLRVSGGLAQRGVLAPTNLPSWPSASTLTNTVVRVLVDAQGAPVSFTMLPPGSGSKEADQYAVTQARTMRFQPAAGAPSQGNPAQGLAWGELIFEWLTTPALTNSP